MVMKLKESESKLEQVLTDHKPDNVEVPAEESEAATPQVNEATVEISEITSDIKNNNDSNVKNNNLKKVTNIENEQINKTLHNIKVEDKKAVDTSVQDLIVDIPENASAENVTSESSSTKPMSPNSEIKKDDEELNEILRRNIKSCVEKVARIEEMKNKDSETQVNVVMCARRVPSVVET